MLENSSLSNKKIIISKKVALAFLEKTTASEANVRDMQRRIAWTEKEQHEHNAVQKFFKPEFASFIIQTPDVRFCIERLRKSDDALTPDASIIPASTLPTRKGQGQDIEYIPQIIYSKHIFENQQVSDSPATDTEKEKLESLVGKRVVSPALKTYSGRKMEADRVLITLRENADDQTIENIENFIAQQYALEMEQFKKDHEASDSQFYGSSLTARVSQHMKTSSGQKLRF